MKLNNQGESVKMIFAGNEHIIPKGEFEVTNQDLANFIYDKGMKWGLPISILSENKAEVIRPQVVQAIKPIVEEKDIVEEKIEATPEQIIEQAESIIEEAKVQIKAKDEKKKDEKKK